MTPNLKIQENVSLKAFNTFGLDVIATKFCLVKTVDELKQAIHLGRSQSLELLILSGGSNLLLSADITGLVIHIAFTGIEYRKGSVSVEAGFPWHEFVQNTLDNGFSGLENLALIPGFVGAAPIQNIGAYGVEVSECIESLNVIEIDSGNELVLSNAQCCFGYRTSIFKTNAKSKFVITAVNFSLNEVFIPRLSYQDLTLKFRDEPDVTPQQVFDAVVSIRQQKLPDPKKLGNAGSFFKNPVITKHKKQQLETAEPALTFNQQAPDSFKISAAKLIDLCGLKGLMEGGAAMSEQHALVMVNLNKATPTDVRVLASKVIEIVVRRFDIELEIEPVWV